MSAPRGLSDEEAAVWAKVAATVTPIERRKAKIVSSAATSTVKTTPPHVVDRKSSPARQSAIPASTPSAGLDSHWDRRVKAGRLEPDFTLDLHGHSLDAAYGRLMDGMVQARAMGARVILLIAGKSRPVDPADRGHKRGAIRAKTLDWLAASPHGDAIAAVRKAHIRHGGDGALYLVLKRGR